MERLPVKKGQIAFFAIKQARAVCWLGAFFTPAMLFVGGNGCQKQFVQADMAVSIDAVGRTYHWRSVAKVIYGSLKLGGIFVIEERFAPDILSKLFPRTKVRASWTDFKDFCDELGLELVTNQRTGFLTHAVFVRTK